MNEDEKEIIIKTLREADRLLAYFSYPECNVCKNLKPKVEALIADYPGINFMYVNIQQHPEISGQYLVFAVPTIIFFEKGKEIKRFSRYFSLGELKNFLTRISST